MNWKDRLPSYITTNWEWPAFTQLAAQSTVCHLNFQTNQTSMDIRLLLHEDSSSSIGVSSNTTSTTRSASSSCSSANSSSDDSRAEASSTSAKQGAERMCGNCGCLKCEWCVDSISI
ncbi:hypothetical protein PF011_g24781 [Phytophthora fragariae]|uniref:Uncharacterized protein n=2 Tax=Phytophthora fragariae TaxID=53985 RepID=A0A6A3DYJ4_9STRA|nr:hypothetical protein PF009_g25357 [Phytophthora fragariae]KAE8974656.1 hypothetical protein PF011_g24781 [Phytophthora fragariae]